VSRFTLRPHSFNGSLLVSEFSDVSANPRYLSLDSRASPLRAGPGVSAQSSKTASYEIDNKFSRNNYLAPIGAARVGLGVAYD
jgi:hypothetical protein